MTKQIDGTVFIEGGGNMSRVYFHTKEGGAEVCGAERAYMGCVISDLLFGFMRSLTSSWGDKVPAIFKHIPDNHYLKTNYQREFFPENFRCYLMAACGDEEGLILDDEIVSPVDLGLNTAFMAGSDPIRLCARIHGQCELHCYILPENFKWFGSIIELGLVLKIFRQGMGWDSVLELLKETKDSPIVLSYSVCDSFPNSGVADWQSINEDKDWYDLPGDEQWGRAMQGLLEQNKTRDLEITPKHWIDFHFNNGLTAFDFLNHE